MRQIAKLHGGKLVYEDDKGRISVTTNDFEHLRTLTPQEFYQLRKVLDQARLVEQKA